MNVTRTFDQLDRYTEKIPMNAALAGKENGISNSIKRTIKKYSLRLGHFFLKLIRNSYSSAKKPVWSISIIYSIFRIIFKISGNKIF